MRVCCAIAVLQPPERILERAGAHVETDVGLSPEGTTPLNELVRAELVGFFTEPSELRAAGTVFPRTDTIYKIYKGEDSE